MRNGFAVEILDQRGAVMLLDEIDDRPGQAVLLGQGDAVLDMADDDQRAQGRFEVVVAVFAGLVLDEIVRLEHLADVVEIAADADQQRIGADGLRGRFGQGRHRHAVRVRSRGAPHQFLQQRMAAVGQLEQADIGDDAEAAFDQRQDAARA